MTCSFLRAVLCAQVFSFGSSIAFAQAPSYPTKPIRILVGFAAGGPSDVAARTIGQKL